MNLGLAWSSCMMGYRLRCFAKQNKNNETERTGLLVPLMWILERTFSVEKVLTKLESGLQEICCSPGNLGLQILLGLIINMGLILMRKQGLGIKDSCCLLPKLCKGERFEPNSS